MKPSIRRNSRGFTLIELLVVIAIIAILAAILFPVFARARENARRASCQSNLKQIGLGIMQYIQDYDEKYPVAWHGPYTAPTATLVDDLDPYIKSKQIWKCPSSPGRMGATAGGPAAIINRPSDYGYHFSLLGMSDYSSPYAGYAAASAQITQPSSTIMAADRGWMLVTIGGVDTWMTASTYVNYPSSTWAEFSSTNGSNLLPILGFPAELRGPKAGGWVIPGGLNTYHFMNPRHLDGANALYCDGHVKFRGSIESVYSHGCGDAASEWCPPGA
jgi:prepilin-type N-terminal cleavage/methylation domain-containing protein/prepilin-type processing-associated H-X9-DG protein